MTTSASVSRGLLLRLGQPLGIRRESLNFRRVDRQHFGADLEAAVGVEQRVEARARAEALMVAALRAHVEVLLEVGAVEHRVAGRRTWSTGLRAPSCVAAPGRCAGSSAAGVSAASSCGRGAWSSIGLRMGLGTPRRAADWSGAPASISWMMRLPITTASASARRGARIRRRGCRSRRRSACGSPRGSPGSCCDVGKIDVRGAGHAAQRHVVEVAAAAARHLVDALCRSRSARAGRSDRRRCASCSAQNSTHSSGG